MQLLTQSQITHTPDAVSRQSPNNIGNEKGGLNIDPVTLAYLDFGLFKSLCKLGVSRQRICSALCISWDDYDYLRELSRA